MAHIAVAIYVTILFYLLDRRRSLINANIEDSIRRCIEELDKASSRSRDADLSVDIVARAAEENLRIARLVFEEAKALNRQSHDTFRASYDIMNNSKRLHGAALDNISKW